MAYAKESHRRCQSSHQSKRTMGCVNRCPHPTERLRGLQAAVLPWLLLAIVVNAGCSPRSSSKSAPTFSRDEANAMLLLASQKSDLRRAHESLELGANPDAFDAESHDGDTPLIIASAQGNIELTKLLLKAGANVNMRRHASVDGATPLMVAAQGNRAEI